MQKLNKKLQKYRFNRFLNFYLAEFVCANLDRTKAREKPNQAIPEGKFKTENKFKKT